MNTRRKECPGQGPGLWGSLEDGGATPVLGPQEEGEV